MATWEECNEAIEKIIPPTSELTVTENGRYNVSEYTTVVVDVEGGSGLTVLDTGYNYEEGYFEGSNIRAILEQTPYAVTKASIDGTDYNWLTFTADGVCIYSGDDGDGGVVSIDITPLQVEVFVGGNSTVYTYDEESDRYISGEEPK